jgi:hypothetical protein
MADINIGAILEALNNKIDRDGHNAQSPCAVIVDKQDPTSANNYTWYRKWSDGWVEQGGVSNGLNAVATLPIAMADINYTLVCSGVYASRTNTGGANWSAVSGDRTSTTTITLGQAAGFATMGWQVSGMAAN